jgi:hypothetical protein
MRGYRPSHFGGEDTLRANLRRKDRAGRIVTYTQSVAQGEPLFEESKPVSLTQHDRPTA